uniref:Mannose-6-phosphate isomerase n=1 Tax=Lygus hesperus TaxID=30085 RepID=A0A0A9XRQ2_LYGHE
MRLLCSFRPFYQIAYSVLMVPEFQKLLPSSYPRLRKYMKSLPKEQQVSYLTHSFSYTELDTNPPASFNVGGGMGQVTEEQKAAEKELLKVMFTELMHAPGPLIETCTQTFLQRFHETHIQKNQFQPYHNDSWFAIGILVQWLVQQYKQDVGVFCPFFLNYFTLQPNQSVFLEPNIPHTYLSGECIEIMACSDNVVRAGLTPKYRDVETLVTMLTYSMGIPARTAGVNITKYVNVYAPPIQFSEFMVLKIQIPSGITKVTVPDIPVLQTDSILLCIRGRGVIRILNQNQHNLTDGTLDCEPYTTSFFAGVSIYIPQGKVLEISSSLVSNNNSDVLFFWAATNKALNSSTTTQPNTDTRSRL